MSQAFFAIALAVCLTPIIVKRHLEELAIVAYSLFAMVVIFVVMIGI